MDTDVSRVFESYPVELRTPLLQIRELIHEVAAEIPEAIQITESLKWGQPSYASQMGTPIRLDRFGEEKIALFVHCQTTLIGDMRGMFADKLEFSKNRAIVLDPHAKLPTRELKLFIEMALTYHQQK